MKHEENYAHKILKVTNNQLNTYISQLNREFNCSVTDYSDYNAGIVKIKIYKNEDWQKPKYQINVIETHSEITFIVIHASCTIRMKVKDIEEAFKYIGEDIDKENKKMINHLTSYTKIYGESENIEK